MAGRADLYGDLSYFMPKKGYFKEPGQFEAALKAEATKKASYLADVEQFYAQLEESARQFDLSYDIQNRSLQQQADLFAQQMKTQKDISRNQIWAGVGTGVLSTAIDAYLKNKDITFQFNWADKWLDKFLGGETEPGYDLSNYDWGDLYSDPTSISPVADWTSDWTEWTNW